MFSSSRQPDQKRAARMLTNRGNVFSIIISQRLNFPIDTAPGVRADYKTRQTTWSGKTTENNEWGLRKPWFHHNNKPLLCIMMVTLCMCVLCFSRHRLTSILQKISPESPHGRKQGEMVEISKQTQSQRSRAPSDPPQGGAQRSRTAPHERSRERG